MDQENYIPGMGCTCHAYDASECGCAGVDWTPREVYRLRSKLKKATELAGELIAMIRMNVMRDTFREATIEQVDEHLKPWIERLHALQTEIESRP